jgi:hypothetical protein
MSKELVRVGFANEGERNLEVDFVKKWEPKNISYIGDTVFFKNDDTYFSMKTVDFKRIFNL